jgi:uncharacterized damage-inducible protein DinB
MRYYHAEEHIRERKDLMRRRKTRYCMELPKSENGYKIERQERENNMHEVIRFYYAYQAWATEKLFTVLEKISKEEYNAPGCSGHGSIRDTLAHCLSAEQGWFSWFDRSKSVSESMAVRLKGEEIETIAKAREQWKVVRQRTEKCISALTENEMRVIWSAATPQGKIALPLWQFLLHVANHGTHTRAQIVSALRRLGHDPGNYDFFQFALIQAS